MTERRSGVDGDRLWRRLGELGGIGRRDSGGVTRLSFSREERAVKELVAAYMREADLSVREDAAGNLIGRRQGREAAPVVLAGSHLDSVYDGGDFDGPLGVLAAVEALQAMEERGMETRRPVEVVAFTDEEGTRFGFGMIGSRALAGTLTSGDLEHRDAEGVSVAEAMRRYGLDPGAIGEAARPAGSVEAYVELHIEQGKVLEDERLPVGVVTGIAGPLWLRFTVEGEAGHAGTTPMGLRRDALAASADIVSMVEAEAAGTGTTVGTVGQLEVSPGGINVIPGRAEFTLDLRDLDERVRDRVEERIRGRAAGIREERGLTLSIETLQRVPPTPCSQTVREAAGTACEEAGIPARSLASGAGHDAMQLKELCPVGMLFVRSQNGVSHHPAEHSSKEDCALGAEALFQTIWRLAS